MLPSARVSRVRASAAVSLALLLASLVGAAQAFLLVFIAGEGPATDAFLACYSVYTALVLLGVSLRRSVVPLLGQVDDEEAFRLRANELLSRTALAGAIVSLGLLAISPLVAAFLTQGLPADARRTGTLTLLVLAPAAYLQIRAGAVSGVLNALRRFPISVTVYVVASTFALGASALLIPAVGPLGAALGLLAGAVILLGGHTLYVRRFGLRSRGRLAWLADRGQLRLLSFILPGSALGIAQQLNLSVALASLAGAGAAPAITGYAYAYFIVALFINLSSYSVSLVALPDAVEAVAARGLRGARDQLNRAVPFVFALLAPMLGAFAAFGKPALDALFGAVLSPSTIELIYTVGLLLVPMTVGLSIYVLAGSMLLALGRRLAAAVVAGLSLILHAGLFISLASLGPEAVAAGHSIGTVVMALGLLAAVFGRSSVRVTGGLLKRVAPAFALALAFPALGALIEADSIWSLGVGLVTANAVYGLLGLLLWPAVARPFLRVVPKFGWRFARR